MHNTNSFAPWALGASLLVVIFFAILSSIQQKKRTTALASLAAAFGFNFEGSEWSDPARAGKFETALFRRGVGQRFRNIMTGTFAGYQVSIFDYLYRTGSGKSGRNWNQTVVAFSQNTLLPVFEMRPERFMDRIGDALTHKDIDFDSHPEFSHRYLLRGDEKEKVRELFTPNLLSFLESLSPEKKWHIEGDGQTLILYRSNLMVEPDGIGSLLEETSSITTSFLGCCGLRNRI